MISILYLIEKREIRTDKAAKRWHEMTKGVQLFTEHRLAVPDLPTTCVVILLIMRFTFL